jgi:hypothetical protein
MSDDEKTEFLSRWSRLKRENAKPAEKPPVETPPPALPPVDKLTAQSDFTGFMHPKVEDALRRVALKKLFSDPHFNLPDPYEAYSGDWTGGEPMTEAMVASLEQMKALVKTPPKPPAAETAEKENDPEPKPQTDEQGKQDVGKQDA